MKLRTFKKKKLTLKSREKERKKLLELAATREKLVWALKRKEAGYNAIWIEDYANAIQIINEAKEADPDNYFYEYLGGLALMKKQSYSKAIKIFCHLTEILDDTESFKKQVKAYCYFYCGHMFSSLKKYDEAIESYTKGFEVDGKESGFFFTYIGWIYYDRSVIDTDNNEEHLKNAEVFFKKACKYHNQRYFAYEGLGSFYYVIKSYEPAVRYLQRAYEYVSEDIPEEKSSDRINIETRIINLIKSSFLQINTVEGCENGATYLEQFFTETNDGGKKYLYSKEIAEVYNRAGNLHFEAGNYEMAIPGYEKAISHNSEVLVYHSNLAGAFEHLNTSESLERAIEILTRLYQKQQNEDYERRLIAARDRERFLKVYGNDAMKLYPTPTPVSLEVSEDLISLFATEDDNLTKECQKNLNTIREMVLAKFGHPLKAGVRIRGLGEDFLKETYIIFIDEVPIVSGRAFADSIFATVSVDELKGSITPEHLGEEGIHHANGLSGTWISKDSKKNLSQKEVEITSPLSYVMAHLLSVIEKNFAGFVTIESVLQHLKEGAPDMVDTIKMSEGGIGRFTDLLKILVEEYVSIEEIEFIAKRYIDFNLQGLPFHRTVEEIRQDETMLPFLPYNKAVEEGLDGDYQVFELSGEIRRAIKIRISTSGDAAVLCIPPELTQKLLSSMRPFLTANSPVIIVEHPDIRRPVKKLIEIEFPHVLVMLKSECITPPEISETINLES